MHVRVVLRRHFQFDIIFLQQLDLFVQVVKLGLVLLDLFLILGDPFLVFCGKFDFVLLKLLNLPLPLVIALGLKQLNLGLKLLDYVVFLLQLHRMEPLSSEITTLIAAIQGR